MAYAQFGGGALRIDFGGGVLRIDNGAEVYAPLLQQALTAELHFVKKVCKPDAAQFDEIHRTGIAAVADLAETYRDRQRRRENPSFWPDPNLAVSFWLYQTVKKIMPAEVTRDYQTEILARKAAHHDAKVTLMVQLIDDQVTLDTDQKRKIHDELVKVWQPEWSHGPMMFLYPQHAVVPGNEILEPYLSDLQKSLWSYRVKRPTIRLPWQSQFEFHTVLVELDPFETPSGSENPSLSDDPEPEESSE